MPDAMSLATYAARPRCLGASASAEQSRHGAHPTQPQRKPKRAIDPREVSMRLGALALRDGATP